MKIMIISKILLTLDQKEADLELLFPLTF